MPLIQVMLGGALIVAKQSRKLLAFVLTRCKITKGVLLSWMHLSVLAGCTDIC
jgi:hypothetical protein